MATLPVFAYYSYSAARRAARALPRPRVGGRALLILIVMTLNLVGRVIARVFAPKTR